jgi:hypothetical protein
MSISILGALRHELGCHNEMPGSSLTEPVRPLRQKLDPVETFARRDVEGALVRPRERRVGALSPGLDAAEILPAASNTCRPTIVVM